MYGRDSYGTGPGSYSGYGGSQHLTGWDANLSNFDNSGSAIDPETGAVGTPRQLAEQRMREGRSLDTLKAKYGR